MANDFADDDIKIAEGSAEKKKDDEQEIKNTVCELRRQKRLGNIERARRMGKNIAAVLTASDTAAKRMSDMNKNTALQARCVMVFGVITGFERYIKNEILSRVALNAFYDSLREYDPEFYNQLNNLAAMSCYYLAARRNGEVEKEIGPTFAMLCKADDDGEFIRLGGDLFGEGLAVTREQAQLNRIK